MIEVISHRGLWKKLEEQNTIEAFYDSLEAGFGIETDIRDNCGDLVISHDIPTQTNNILTVDDFFNLYQKYGKNQTLALNIKSDGLSKLLKQKLDTFEINNYFVFDMSIPDTLSYQKESLNFFSRQSEYEMTPALYDKCSGVWIDSFHSAWVKEGVIIKHSENRKNICIVSPELHKRSHLADWKKYKDISNNNSELTFIICTDFPVEARSFFEE